MTLFIFSVKKEYNRQDMEPPVKRNRIDDSINSITIKNQTGIDNLIDSIINSKNQPQIILGDEYYQTLPLIKVFIGHVKQPKDISKLFEILNEKLPLKYLLHLKRVRKKDILLSPVSFLNSDTQESIQEYIERNIPEIKDCFEYFREATVPLTPPLTRKQYMENLRHWSLNFHPNHYIETIMSDQPFKQSEARNHRIYMALTFEIVKWYFNIKSYEDILQSDFNAAVVVDPTINSVVTLAVDNRHEHPLQHPAMLAIDNVAKTQEGGAWKIDIDDTLKEDLKEKFKIQYGTRSGTAESPYLCTGYYVYLLREPCIMCSMGLVHARAKKIFFSLDTPLGGLKSKTKLQCIESLNHRFEVFTGFL